MSGWDSFVQGYSMGKSMANDYQTAQKKSDIADLSKEQDSQVYTPEQGQQLEAIANAKDQDGNPLYNLAASPDGTYQVTQTAPGADGKPVAPATIAAGGTSYLGKTYAQPITDTQRSAAKQLAMAGIMDKYGDTEGGMRFRDNALALQRADKAESQGDQRFAWEKSRNERDIRQGDLAEQDQQTMRDVDTKTADWFKKKLTNEDGTQRDATIDDHLAATQFRATALTQAGKVGEAGKVMAEHNSQALIKIQLESAQRDQDLGKTAAALNAGDLGAVKDFYNKYVPDGAKVTNVSRDAKGQINIERESLDGHKMPPTVLKDTGQMVAALASFKDPMALYQWSQNEFRNNLALRQDSREGARLGMAQEAQDATMEDRDNMRTASVAYEKARQAGDTKGMQAATLELIKAGGTSPGAAAGNAPAEVKLATAMVAAGMAPDMRTGLEMAISKKGMSGDEIHQGFVTAGIKNMSSATDSVAKADEAMKAMGYSKSNGRWSSTPSGGASSGSDKPPQTFATPLDVEAAARAGKVKAGDTVMVGGRRATWK